MQSLKPVAPIQVASGSTYSCHQMLGPHHLVDRPINNHVFFPSPKCQIWWKVLASDHKTWLGSIPVDSQLLDDQDILEACGPNSHPACSGPPGYQEILHPVVFRPQDHKWDQTDIWDQIYTHIYMYIYIYIFICLYLYIFFFTVYQVRAFAKQLSPKPCCSEEETARVSSQLVACHHQCAQCT